MNEDWKALADGLRRSLALRAPPIAITFHDAVPDVERFDAPMPPPAPDGRTGRVSAGCVFWMRSTSRTFTTVPEDHGNCSVGLLTHGMTSLDDVAGNSDVAALLECGWVTTDVVAADSGRGRRGRPPCRTARSPRRLTTRTWSCSG